RPAAPARPGRRARPDDHHGDPRPDRGRSRRPRPAHGRRAAGMITIALATLRLRWRSFAGTFVALALGSALMAALGLVLDTTVTSPDKPPQRYSTVPVVVAASQTLTVPTARGSATAELAIPR